MPHLTRRLISPVASSYRGEAHLTSPVAFHLTHHPSPHFLRHANETSDIGRFAIYCERSLDRILKNGEREARPSRLEAGAILQRNPFYRIFPLNMRVDFINNSYQIFSFDGSTTVAEFHSRINDEIGIRDNSESGFALYAGEDRI